MPGQKPLTIRTDVLEEEIAKSDHVDPAFSISGKRLTHLRLVFIVVRTLRYQNLVQW